MLSRSEFLPEQKWVIATTASHERHVPAHLTPDPATGLRYGSIRRRVGELREHLGLDLSIAICTILVIRNGTCVKVLTHDLIHDALKVKQTRLLVSL